MCRLSRSHADPRLKAPRPGGGFLYLLIFSDTYADTFRKDMSEGLRPGWHLPGGSGEVSTAPPCAPPPMSFDIKPASMAHPRRRHKSNHHSFNTKKEPTDNYPGNELGGPQGRSSQKGNDKI